MLSLTQSSLLISKTPALKYLFTPKRNLSSRPPL